MAFDQDNRSTRSVSAGDGDRTRVDSTLDQTLRSARKSNAGASDRAEPEDTIVALASGGLPCAVAVIRVSGTKVRKLARRLIGGLPPARQASLRRFCDLRGRELDQGLTIYFPKPHSYTGEDVLELQLHGSIPVVQAVIDTLCTLGARHALPGEFTQRAFFNQRLDLAQAEAVADLISAQTARAARAAHQTLYGRYSQLIHKLQDGMTQLRVRLEACIDFPEEEVPENSYHEIKTSLSGLLDRTQELLKGTQKAVAGGQVLKIVLVGAPNAGKSTLLNALSGEDLAIVSAKAGTTRDTIVARLQIGGHSVHITDTAGIREDGDEIEREGMRRTRASARRADRIWWIRDQNLDKFNSREDLRDWLDVDTDYPIDIIYNKIDLGSHPPRWRREGRRCAVWLSAKTKVGLENLGSLVMHSFEEQGDTGETEFEYSARRRHGDALQKTRLHLINAAQSTDADEAWEIIAEELCLAQFELDAILGAVSSDELLGEIFSQFCIGK